MSLCRRLTYVLLLTVLQGCAVSWVGNDGSQHRAGLMWLRQQQRSTGTMQEANQPGLLLSLDRNCLGASLGLEQIALASASPTVSAQSLPGGWRDADGIDNYLGLVRSSYLPSDGPRLRHDKELDISIKGGPGCLGLNIGWQSSLRVLYEDADGHWRTDYDSSAPFETQIVPGNIHAPN